MIESIKSETKPKEAQFIHQGIIKILVDYQLKVKGLVWEDFLVENKFVEQVVEKKLKPTQETRNIVHSIFILKKDQRNNRKQLF